MGLPEIVLILSGASAALGVADKLFSFSREISRARSIKKSL